MNISVTTPGEGITGGLDNATVEIQTTIATLAAVTWYNAIELVILVFVTFREYHGLYFWSLLVSASVGLVPYSLGFMLKFFELASSWFSVSLLTVGWYCMVTGQSVVLYSRLHLVLRNRKVLRRVLAMICIDAVLLHIPTTVLTYGSNKAPEDTIQPYIKGYNAMEKIQMTGFCIQEFLISGLYIWETLKMMRVDPNQTNHKSKLMYQLVIINLIIIAMDVGLLVIEYIGLYTWETMIKGVIYSIKLKLEFAVLGKLVRLVHCHVWKSDSVILHYHDHPRFHRHTPSGNSPEDFPDFVDATRVTSDLTRAPTFTTTTDTVTSSSTRTRTRGNTIPAAVIAGHRAVPHMDSDDISIAMFEHLDSAPSYENDRENHIFIHDHAYDDVHDVDIGSHLDQCPELRGAAQEVDKVWIGSSNDAHSATTTATSRTMAGTPTTAACPLDFTESLGRQAKSPPPYSGEDQNHPG